MPCALTVSTKNATLERVYNDTLLECRITDQDESTNYTVTWYKHGSDDTLEEITTAKKLHSGRAKYDFTKREDGTNVLTIKRTADGDVGQYDCAVTLGTGEAQRTLKQDLHVHGNLISRRL